MRWKGIYVDVLGGGGATATVPTVIQVLQFVLEVPAYVNIMPWCVYMGSTVGVRVVTFWWWASNGFRRDPCNEVAI